MLLYGVRGISPRSFALETQAVLQGALVLAKADGGPAAAAESVERLKRYLRLLFNKSDKRGEKR